MRRRINLSIQPELYRELIRIQQRYGFKNLCEVNVAMLRLLVQYIQANEQRERDESEDDAEDIEDMFHDFGCWERTPDGTVPVRHPRHDIDR